MRASLSSVSKTVRRFGPIALVGVGLVTVFVSGAYRHASLEAMSSNYMAWRTSVSAHPVMSGALFTLAYVSAVAVSLPGTLFISMVGGLLFGWALGAALGWVAAVLGAILVFLAARTALRDPFQAMAGGERIAQLKRGLEGDAFLYLLVLRFMPLPFFLVNIAPAFFKVGLRDYASATALGLIPVSIAFAAIGAGAGDVLAAGETLTAARLADPKIGAGVMMLGVLTVFALWAKRRHARHLRDEPA